MGRTYDSDWVERAHRFAVRVLVLINDLPRTPVGFNIAGQLTRSTLAIPYNLEEARSANTEPDTLAKTAIARKESTETRRGLMVIRDVGGLVPAGAAQELAALIDECQQLAAMLSTGVMRLEQRIAGSRARSRKPVAT